MDSGASPICDDRVDDRRALLTRLDQFQRASDASRKVFGTDEFTDTALNIVTSGAAREAFDLTKETSATRDLYGRNRWGQFGLLARRLVESGVSFVTINTAPDSLSWDWHRNIVNDNRPADGSDGPSGRACCGTRPGFPHLLNRSRMCR